MSNIKTFQGNIPDISSSAFIADSARVIGKIKIGEEASVWFGAVLRGDTETIEIGDGSNVQDNAVIHTDPGFPVLVGKNCIIGHGAIVHGAELENNVLVGMNATILNGAHIGAFSIIGANALVTSNTFIPPNSVVMGIPGKVVATVNEDGKQRIGTNARVYRERAAEYLAEL